MSVSTWSLDGVQPDGRWPAVDGERSIREALWNILLTRPGERLMRPEFGVGIERFVHEPNNATTRHLIADHVGQAVRRWEPRVDLDAVEVVSDARERTRVHVAIRYRIRQTGARAQLDLSLEIGA